MTSVLLLPAFVLLAMRMNGVGGDIVSTTVTVPGFLPFVRPTLGYVRDALCRLEMEDMLTLLSPYLPEFGDEKP